MRDGNSRDGSFVCCGVSVWDEMFCLLLHVRWTFPILRDQISSPLLFVLGDGVATRVLCSDFLIEWLEFASCGFCW